MKTFILVCFLVLAFARVSVIGAPADFKVGPLPGERQAVPTGQILRSPGQTVYFKGRPVDMVMSPTGRTFYIKDYQKLLVVDNSTWTLEQSIHYPSLPASMHGIAVNHAATHVYVTSIGNELYDFTADPHGTVSYSRTIPLATNSDPCGIALSADGKTAYVCLGKLNTLGVVDLANGKLTGQIDVGIAPWGVAISRDGTTAYVSDWGGRHPGENDLKGTSLGIPIVVDNRGIAASGVVSIVDLAKNLETAEVPTDLHPCDLRLSLDDQTLYIANANSDTVTVINTATKTVKETISTRPDSRLPFGSAADGLSLSRDGATLYVADGGNNAIAVIELPNEQHTNSIVQGFIPTDWYPGAVFADLYHLYIANVKGLGSTNRDIYQLTGTVKKLPLPTADSLSKMTAEAIESSRVPQMLDTQTPARPRVSPVPVPVHVGEPSIFQHVLYVIKENKTYDQMFGDIRSGNGDPKLCVFDQHVSPNHHALATKFVLLDNYYCNGVYSTDGHSWCTEANSTDYWEKSLGASNRSGQWGNDPLIYSSSGFIWNNVLQHGLTLHNYGVLSMSFPKPGNSWLQIYADYTSHAGHIQFNTYTGNSPVLPAYSSTNVSGFNLGIPDQLRADGFLEEFRSAESKGVWPAFNMLYLPDDHTAGGSAGYPTPRAQIADNDLALGRVIEAITKSSFWKDTVVFVIEDDPQSGYDHVDGHRSICLVISPYTKRGQTVSTFYNQIGLIHTMEQILGLPPMNQMDAMGPLMSDCFSSKPNFAPYAALANNIPLNEMNPGTIGSLNRKDRYWEQLSEQMDFSKPDLVNDDTLNRIIWHSIKGDVRYPAEFAGPHGKALKQLGLVASKHHGDDDD